MATPAIGSRITQLSRFNDDLPIGSVIRNINNDYTLTKTGPTTWHRNNDHPADFEFDRIDRITYDLVSVPDEPAPTRPAVGAQVIIRRDNEQLPIGTVVVRNGEVMTKVSETDWIGRQDGRTYEYDDLTASRTILSYPDEPVADARPEVGSFVTICNDNDRLPVGTVLHSRQTNRRMTKISDQRWRNESGGWYNYETLEGERVVVSYPDAEPVAEVVAEPVVEAVVERTYRLYTLDTIITTEELDHLPTGTVVTDYPDRRDYFTKLEDQRWQRRSDSTTYSARDFSASYVIDSIPVTSQVQAQCDAMRQRIRECIDECVRQHNPASGHVRDGAWIKLGFEPIPERGASIQARTAYGLPNHSLVEQRGRLFRVDDQRDWPERFSPSGTAHAQNFDIESNVTVIWTPEAEAPIFYSDLDLLHKFWDIYRKMRPLHRWCDFVDERLRGCDLNDPGEQPQQFTQAEAVVEPETVIELGLLDTRQLSRATQERVLAAFRAMPAGSVCSGHETYVKTPTTWVRAADPRRPVFDGPTVTYVNVTIDYIAQVRAVAEQSTEPF